MKKTKESLNSKMQVKLPDSLSTENIMANIDNSKAEIVDIPKKKSVAKKLVPLVASLFLVIGIVGVFMSIQQKNEPIVNNGDITEVMSYQSYDKIYEKFDAIHKELKKNEFRDFFYGIGSDGAAVDIADEEVFFYADDSAAGSTATGAIAGSTATEGSSSAESETAVNINGSITTDSPSESKNHGTTNTQEKDVDEGDIIKTDGNYLYIANGERNSVSIVDVTGEKMAESSQLDMKDTEFVQEIYINSDRLVIVGALQKEEEEKSSYAYGTYAVVDRAYYMASDVFVKVYDISNRKAPKLVTEFTQQGTYENSRMIGTKLYTISQYYVNIYNDNYRNDCIPEITFGDTCEKIPAGCISIIEESKSTTYAVITTLDLNKDTEPESSAILGECNNLYASSKGLFLAATTYEEMQDITKIYKFDYTDTGVEYKCTGKVRGYINNQFSMSYDGEYFRIATTQNNPVVSGDSVSVSLDDRTNNLYILNNQMQIVGKVEDLAKGELIESVRFVGNMAYVVTFRQTDPLFVIDLSDPENPTVKGELKIPGFSEYLHPITKNLIVGVGQDGTETGTNGDCKVSLFDVTDPYAPKETVSLPVTGGNCHVYTGVSYNHKLFIPLSDTEFVVPFNLDWYVKMGDIEKGGNFYIRYKLQNGTLCETGRYFVSDEKCEIMGATYVGNTFYVVNHNYGKQITEIVAFDLITHNEIDRITTYEK